MEDEPNTVDFTTKTLPFATVFFPHGALTSLPHTVQHCGPDRLSFVCNLALVVIAMSGDPDMTMDTASTAATAIQTGSNPTTQDHIQTLMDFHARLQSVRRIPSLLLRPSSGSSLSHAPEFHSPFETADHDFAATFQTTPAQHFRTLKAIADALCAEKVQTALKVARESENADKSDIGPSFQGESHKQRK